MAVTAGNTQQLPELQTFIKTVDKRVRKLAGELKELVDEKDGLEKISVQDLMESDRIRTAGDRARRDLLDTAEKTRILLRIAETPQDIEALNEQVEEIIETLDGILSGAKAFEVLSRTRIGGGQEAARGGEDRQPITGTLVKAAPDLIKLPVYDLPRFSGNYSDWPSFWDQFDASVDSRGNLSDVHKLIYLRGCLVGDALDIIKPLPTREDSYRTALQLLRQRFDDPLMIVREVVDAIFSAPSVQRDSVNTLRRLVNTFTEKVQTLKNIGLRDGYFFLSQILLRKLDLDTRRAWETFQSDKLKWENVSKGLSPTARTAVTKMTLVSDWDEEYDLLCAFLLDRLQTFERASKGSPRVAATPAKHSGAAAEERGQNGHLPMAASAKPVSSPVSPRPSANTKCPVCKSRDHYDLKKCTDFLKMDSVNRHRIVRETNACYSCLSFSHMASKCATKFTCKLCKSARHHTLLHRERPAASAALMEEDDYESDQLAGLSVTRTKREGQGLAEPAKSCVALGSVVFLCTVQVPCVDSYGGISHLRAMLDTGSQVNVVSAEAVERLGLQISKSTVSIAGVGGTRPQRTGGCVRLDVMLPGDSKMRLHCDVLQRVVGDLCTARIPKNFLAKFEGYTLADPLFHSAKNIDLLIGMANYNDLILKDRVQVDNLWLQHTVFGWAVTGKPGKRSKPQGLQRAGTLLEMAEPATSSSSAEYEALERLRAETESLQQFQKFWEMEETPDTGRPILTEEQKMCEHFHNQTTTRLPDGRVKVRLPFKPDAPALGRSKAQAVRRFLSMETRLSRDKVFREKYNAFIQEFLDMGHLEKVPDRELERADERCFYMPHHGVLKESSTTTKLRVVFDGSARTTTGVDLNSTLMKGPRIQDNIFAILIRFRFHVVALSGDVTKMYRQVELDEKDRDFQRLIWRFGEEEPLSVYRLTRVIYGVRSSGYHAIRALKAGSLAAETPAGSVAIKRDFYVDDLLTGADTAGSAIELISDVTQALACVQMPIRKWCSNSQTVIEAVPEGDRETVTVEVAKDDECGVKMLGVAWNMKSDCFVFTIPAALLAHPATSHPHGDLKITKRQLLSAIATMFDPLGWLAPLTVKMKILFQQSWSETSSLDELLPQKTVEQFRQWIEEAHTLQFLEIPRRMLSVLPEISREYYLCLFTDASEQAMCASIYIVYREDGKRQTETSNDGPHHQGVSSLWSGEGRQADSSGDLGSPGISKSGSGGTRQPARLLCAKTKLAPKKTQSVARLELAAMWLGAQLLDAVQAAIAGSNYDCLGVEAYTDSTTALIWARAEPARWNTFVANRVTKIQELMDVRVWHHIPGVENPADLGTRYSTANIGELEMWWRGPPWLSEMGFFFPQFSPDISTTEDMKKQVVGSTILHDDEGISVLPVDHISDFGKLVRITLTVMRFLQKLLRRPAEPAIPDAVGLLIRQEQEHFYAAEIKALETNSALPSTSSLLKLTPFIDPESGLLRVGGRLKFAEIGQDARQPVIIPGKSPLALLYVRHIHLRLYHAGSGPVRVQVQTLYWIPGLKTLIRKVIHACVRCARFNTRPIIPLLGDLPAARVRPSAPFTHTGLDYAGPFMVLSGFGGC